LLDDVIYLNTLRMFIVAENFNCIAALFVLFAVSGQSLGATTLLLTITNFLWVTRPNSGL